MEIWLLVIILLVIAIIFLVASLFTKSDGDLEDLINENITHISQELNSIKTRLSELEATVYQSSSHLTSENPITDTTTYSPQDPYVVNNEEINLDDNPEIVSEQTRNSIIQMYSQGFTLQEINEEVGLDTFTIQSIVDDYIENR